MKQRLICWLVGCLLATSLSAQVSGFRGRRFVLKSDVSSLLLPNRTGRSLALETVLLRNASIMVGYRDFSQNIGGYRSDNFNSLTASNQVFFIEARKYFRRGLPAPLGRFMYLRYGRDRAQLKGSKNIRERSDATGEEIFSETSFHLRNLPGIQWEFGIGHQWVVLDRISLELAVGYMATWYEDTEEYAPYLEGSHQTLGPNWANLNIIDNLGWAQGGIGLTLSLSAGILLF
ncbi:MAG: hypothetical protein AAF399_19570 [Bacteroidota bacterium]